MKVSALLAASMVNAHHLPVVESSLTAGPNETFDMPEFFQHDRAETEATQSAACKSLKQIGLDFVVVR